jgi:hypothetical protein
MWGLATALQDHCQLPAGQKPAIQRAAIEQKNSEGKKPR